MHVEKQNKTEAQISNKNSVKKYECRFELFFLSWKGKHFRLALLIFFSVFFDARLASIQNNNFSRMILFLFAISVLLCMSISIFFTVFHRPIFFYYHPQNKLIIKLYLEKCIRSFFTFFSILPGKFNSAQYIYFLCACPFVVAVVVLR